MTLSAILLLCAAGAQIAILLAVGALTFGARRAAFASGAVKMADVAIEHTAYPEDARRLAANLRNQFETPPYFLAGVAAAFATGATGWIMAALAWSWIAARALHAREHCGANHLMRRAKWFAASLALLSLFWAAIIVSAVI